MPARTLLATLALALGACAGADTGSLSSERLDVAPTEEVLATSEAIVGEIDSDLDVDEVLPGASTIAAYEEVESVDSAAELRPVARFKLRRGETLAHYARWSGVPVEDIAEVSELDLDGLYEVGTEVVVPVQGQALAALTTERDRHHTARAEAYLASRGGSSGSAFVPVRTGDTAWSIAKDADGIPVWMLEVYNPAVDLERLRPGQQLMIPVLTVGTVAQVEEVPIDLLDEAGDTELDEIVEPIVVEE